MLARNAESLYWIGRYIERADDTARILDVAVHQLLEDSTLDVDAVARRLLGVLGVAAPDEPVDVHALTALVAYDRNDTGSICDAWGRARENARGAREVTSSELWECVNAGFVALRDRERTAKRLGPHVFFHFIKDRAAAFAGLADATLSHDDGYRFLVLGRSIERVDMMTRLLLSRVGDDVASPAWVAVLRSAGAHDTYLRAYRGALDARRVVEFMLLDRLFPRSVFSALREVEACLDALDRSPASRLGRPAEAGRLLGRMRSELEFLAPGGLLDALAERLDRLQWQCRALGDAVAVEYFHSAPWVAWSDARGIDTDLRTAAAGPMEGTA